MKFVRDVPVALLITAAVPVQMVQQVVGVVGQEHGAGATVHGHVLVRLDVHTGNVQDSSYMTESATRSYSFTCSQVCTMYTVHINL